MGETLPDIIIDALRRQPIDGEIAPREVRVSGSIPKGLRIEGMTLFAEEGVLLLPPSVSSEEIADYIRGHLELPSSWYSQLMKDIYSRDFSGGAESQILEILNKGGQQYRDFKLNSWNQFSVVSIHMGQPVLTYEPFRVERQAGHFAGIYDAGRALRDLSYQPGTPFRKSLEKAIDAGQCAKQVQIPSEIGFRPENYLTQKETKPHAYVPFWKFPVCVEQTKDILFFVRGKGALSLRRQGKAMARVFSACTMEFNGFGQLHHFGIDVPLYDPETKTAGSYKYELVELPH